jgi:hypothetical protein
MKDPLEKFGAFFVQNLRDKMLYDLDMLMRGAWKSPETEELQKKISGFSDVEKQIARDMTEKIITTGMHDLLFALQEEADASGSIQVLVDGEEVAKLSDGLQGEIFGNEGWIAHYSKYPSEIETKRSRLAKDQVQKMFGDKSNT